MSLNRVFLIGFRTPSPPLLKRGSCSFFWTKNNKHSCPARFLFVLANEDVCCENHRERVYFFAVVDFVSKNDFYGRVKRQNESKQESKKACNYFVYCSRCYKNWIFAIQNNRQRDYVIPFSVFSIPLSLPLFRCGICMAEVCVVQFLNPNHFLG